MSVEQQPPARDSMSDAQGSGSASRRNEKQSGVRKRVFLRWTAGVLIGLAVVGTALVVWIWSELPAIQRKARIVKSSDNISGLLKVFIGTRMVHLPWPPYSGKRFVLSLATRGALDRRDPKQLVMLFSPGDSTRSLADAGGVAAYEAVTKDSLRDDGPDVSRLTSYVGRRNSEPDRKLTSEQLLAGAPVIADLSFKDIAIVGFTTGEVKVMSREQLGLGPDDPIVAGDASKSAILRVLGE